VKDPLEELLLRQPLSEPPASLEQRVRRRFRQGRMRRAGKQWRWPVATAATLAAAILAAVFAPGPPVVERNSFRFSEETRQRNELRSTKAPDSAPVASPRPLRVEFERSVLLDDGVVVLENNMAVRKLRRETIRHVVWDDPERNLRIETSLPCEQVVLVREVTY
jgi:hypothetical protein